MNKKFYLSLITVVILAVIFFSWKTYYRAQYKKNAEYAISKIVETSALSDAVCSYYYSVWRNAIYKENSYYNGGKYHLKDFNEALVIAKDEMQNQIVGIISTSDSLEFVMGKLKNPPQSYQAIYTDLVSMYGMVKEYAGFAESPTGSLQSFSQKASLLSSQISTKLNEVKIKMP